MRVITVFLSILFILYAVPSIFHIANAVDIVNPTFEEGLTGWTGTTGTVTFSIANDTSYDASHSAKISYSATTSNGIKQSFTGIVADTTYEISGFVKPADAVKKAYIRIAWYQTGSTSQLKTDDSPLPVNANEWNYLQFTAVAPPNANSAEMRLLVSEGSAYFDKLSMVAYVPPTSTPTSVPTSMISQNPIYSPTPSPTFQPVDYPGVWISEVLAYPDTSQNEWVELYNSNEYDVHLRDWLIDDQISTGSTPKKFSSDIPSKQYVLVELTTSMFNNDGDQVRLLNGEGVEKDSFEYSGSTKGLSWGKITLDSDEVCLENPTPRTINSGCIVTKPTPSVTLTITGAIQPAKPTSVRPIPTMPIAQKKKPIPAFKHYISHPNSSNQKLHDTDSPAVLGTEIRQTAKFSSGKMNALIYASFIYSMISIVSLMLKVFRSEKMNTYEIS